MKIFPLNPRLREWLSVVGALAIGPVFEAYGYASNLMFGLAAAAYFWVCMFIVPLLTYAAGRLKFVVWQLAVVSLTLTTIADNLRGGRLMHGRELFSVAYAFWTLGTLLSSPRPAVLILRPMPPRQRYIAGGAILVFALALYLTLALIPQ